MQHEGKQTCCKHLDPSASQTKALPRRKNTACDGVCARMQTIQGSRLMDDYPSLPVLAKAHTTWRKAHCVQLDYKPSWSGTWSLSATRETTTREDEAEPLLGSAVLSAVSADASSRINSTASKSSFDNCLAFVFSRFLRRSAFLISLAKRLRSPLTRACSLRMFAMSAFKLARLRSLEPREALIAWAIACTEVLAAAGAVPEPALPAAPEARGSPEPEATALAMTRWTKQAIFPGPAGRKLRRTLHA